LFKENRFFLIKWFF